MIDGMIPDFFNVNGRKAVIEMFGRYWHENVANWRRTELGRVMAFKPFGVDCLVIWEEELRDEANLVAKVRTFLKKNGKGKDALMGSY